MVRNDVRRPGEVYFVQHGNDGPVKIGFRSLSSEDRIANLQTGNPVELRRLAALPGTPEDEKTLHHSFRKLRIRGEWFRLEEPLLGFIRAVQRGILVRQQKVEE